MAEPAEMGVSESTVAVSEVAGGEDRLGSDACFGEGQTEPSLSVGSLGRTRASGTCNGEDVIVDGSGKAELTMVEAASDAYAGHGLSCTESNDQNSKAEEVCVSAKADIEPVSNVEQVMKSIEPEEEEDNPGCSTVDETSSVQSIHFDAESVETLENENISLNPNVEDSSEIRKKNELEKGSDDGTQQSDFNMMDAKEEKSTADESTQANMKYGQEIEVKHETNAENCGFHIMKEIDVSGNANQARYHMPAENENEFFVSDLVWGKVRSHPWWPGQIFDPSDSSEKAIKNQKKDCFLVAYFGDGTFAWNEASFLKPFRTHFSDMEKQSSSESFHNAVDCALEEVSRRIELGLTCNCTQRSVYERIRFQNIENAGIREESSRRDRTKSSSCRVSFEADKLINYLKDLAKFPIGGIDRLELSILMTQLAAFNSSRGYGDMVQNDKESFENEGPASEFVHNSSLAFDDAEKHSSSREILKGQNGCLNTCNDILSSNKKERSLSELMDETMDSRIGDSMTTDKKSSNVTISSSFGKKRKAIDYSIDDSTASAKVSKVISLKQSFKIGDCIRRAASQMTGNTFVKVNTEKFHKGDGSIDEPIGDGFDHTMQGFEDDQRGKTFPPISGEISSLDELLSQLQLAAQDPLKGCSFSSIVVSFFTEFRDSISSGCQNGAENLISNKVGRKRKKSSHLSPEIFEFEDMSDTYWTDRVIENGTEGQPLSKNRKRDTQLVESEKSAREGRRYHSKKQYTAGNHDLASLKFSASSDGRSLGELVMNFSDVDSVPSEMSLIKMFRRFGPLRESETEVDREGGRARVIFKNRSDAEVAYSSAQKFNIFGQKLVNYQLNYTPTLMFKTPPIVQAHDHGIHIDFSSSQYHEMQLDLASIQDHEMHLDLASLDDHEMQLDLSSIQYPEMEPILFTAQLEDMQSNISIDHCDEKQAEISGFQQREMSPDRTPGDQYAEDEFSPNETDGLNHGSVITEGQRMNPGPAVLKDEEMIAEHSTSDEQNMKPGYATVDQDMNPILATIDDEIRNPDLATTEDLDMNPNLTSATDNSDLNTVEGEEYAGITPTGVHDTKPNQVAIENLEMDEHIDNTTAKKLDTESNHVTTQDLDLLSDPEKVQDQDIHDLEIKQDEGYQVDYNTKLEIIEKDEMQTVAETSTCPDIESDITPTPDRKTS